MSDMILALYYFTDEAEQLVGPYRTDYDARMAALLYGLWLRVGKDGMTEQQQAAMWELNRESGEIKEGMQ